MSDWKNDHADESYKAVQHDLVESVIKEFMGNVGLTDAGLPAYGIRKVAMYTAQVARAQALGFDPDLLRHTEHEGNESVMKMAAAAASRGVPVAVVVAQ